LLGRWQPEAGSREKESHRADVLKEQLAFSVAWEAKHCSCLLRASTETTCMKYVFTAGGISEVLLTYSTCMKYVFTAGGIS